MSDNKNDGIVPWIALAVLACLALAGLACLMGDGPGPSGSDFYVR